MLKKSGISALVLLALGAATLAWVLTDKKNQNRELARCKLKYGAEADKYLQQYDRWRSAQSGSGQQSDVALFSPEQREDKSIAQIRAEQDGRLKADIDKLAAGEMDVYPFADLLYGAGWQQKVQQYKGRQEVRESLFTASVVCTAIAGTGTVSCLILWISGLLIKATSRASSLLSGLLGGRGDCDDSGKDETSAGIGEEDQRHIEDLVTLDNSGTAACDPDGSRPLLTRGDRSLSQAALRARSKLRSGAAASAGSAGDASGGCARDGSANIALLLSDCVSGEDESPVVASKGPRRGGLHAVVGQVTTRPVQVALKTQTADLERQMESAAADRKMAQGVQQTTIEQSKPLNDALTQLTQLTQEVSAIREYAACQQQRIERLQDGYDWNIVRTFCLRMIRCIDNIESRIARLCELGVDAEDLRQVKDELVFALESSGVEQFEPEIGHEFRGLQKCAEAVRERQSCDDPALAGKIACVIRPGYEYHVEEGNVKVVRPAQVKLYG